MDRLIAEFDRALRALSGISSPGRPSPAGAVPEAPLQPAEREQSAALMRVNHAGEVCAQALYQGQALTARDPRTRESLERAAREEEDHLVWSSQRIRELGGNTSVLNPLWYLGSLGLGAAAGLLGDRWSLAFLAETERQVEAHLTGHLDQLPPGDRRTRAVVEAMRADEAGHRETAIGLGAAELPLPVRRAMHSVSRVMTGLSRHL